LQAETASAALQRDIHSRWAQPQCSYSVEHPSKAHRGSQVSTPDKSLQASLTGRFRLWEEGGGVVCTSTTGLTTAPGTTLQWHVHASRGQAQGSMCNNQCSGVMSLPKTVLPTPNHTTQARKTSMQPSHQHRQWQQPSWPRPSLASPAALTPPPWSEHAVSHNLQCVSAIIIRRSLRQREQNTHSDQTTQATRKRRKAAHAAESHSLRLQCAASAAIMACTQQTQDDPYAESARGRGQSC
jgi:hypothetical protein